MPLNFISAAWKLLEIQRGLLVFYYVGTPFSTEEGGQEEHQSPDDAQTLLELYSAILHTRER